jgi:hypothetical protein
MSVLSAFIIVATLVPLAPRVETTLLTEYLQEVTGKQYEQWEFRRKEIPQYFFDDIVFFEIDTATEMIHPRPLSKREFRVAIDRNLDVFTIVGPDSNAYNEVVSRYPIRITLDNVYGYGRWYIELCYLYHDEYFFSSANDFIELQRGMALSDIDSDHPEKNIEDEERQYRVLCEAFNFNRIIHNRESESFLCDYFLWERFTGNILHYQVDISEEGICELLLQEVAAEGIGYWANRRI